MKEVFGLQMKIRRINSLIQYLLDLDNFVTVEKISNDLSFSVRSVHNYLNSDYFCEVVKYADLQRVPNKGVYLTANESIKQDILKKVRSDITINPAISDDLLKVVIHLLCDKKRFDLQQLSNYLFRSESTTQRILKEVERYIGSFSCELTLRRNYGFSIVGNEKDIRSLFLFSLRKLNESDDIYYRSRMSAHTQHVLQQFISPVETESIVKIIDNLESLNSYYCDTDYNLLILHLLITLLRVRNNHFVEELSSRVNDFPEYQNAILIKVYLEKYFSIHLNEAELENITLILISLRKQVNAIPVVEERSILNKFINLLSNKLNIDLNNDMQLKQNLLTHLRPTITRLKLKTYSKNPILDHIKSEYTEVYISVMTTIEELEEKNEIYFDANEIGYICLHIIASINKPSNIKKIKALLLCNEGLSIEQYYKNLIETKFQNIDIDKSIQYINSKSFEFESYDIVFNTTNLFIDNNSVFDISTNISDFEINRIRIFLESLLKNNLMNDLMSNNLLLFFRDNISNQTELIEKYSHYLFEHGYVDNGFYDSVITRQKISSTYISRGIAVPHGSVDLVKESVIVIIILDNPIDWDKEQAQIILFIVSNNEHVNSFNQLLRSVLRVASSDKLTNLLLSCNNKKELIGILSSV